MANQEADVRRVFDEADDEVAERVVHEVVGGRKGASRDDQRQRLTGSSRRTRLGRSLNDKIIVYCMCNCVYSKNKAAHLQSHQCLIVF